MATLVLAKSANPDPAVVGRDLTYSLAVTNLGPDTATSVVVTDLLPVGVTVVSAVGCTVVGRLVTCVRGDLPPGNTGFVTIIVRPTVAGPLVNLASALGGNTNLATVVQTTQVLAPTTLTLTKTASPTRPFVGAPLTFTLAVRNAGVVPAENVVLRDLIPANVTFVSASVPCTLGPTRLLACNLGTIPAGSTATVTITVIPTTPGPVVNEATAVGANTNVAAASSVSEAILAADLALTKTANAVGQVNEGLTFTETVVNLGPSTATGVTLTDTLPANVRLISATPSQGTCTITGRTVTCLLGTLAPGASATVRILTVPTAPGRITNSATVTANEFDPNPANNTAAVTVVVNQCSTGIF